MAQERETLSRFVAGYRRKAIYWRCMRMSVATGCLFFVFLAIMQAGFALFPWTLLTLVFDLVFSGVCLYLVGFIVLATTRRTPTHLAVARMIERASGKKSLFLSLALELTADPRTRGNPFTEQVCRRAATELSLLPRRPAPPRFLAQGAVTAAVLAAWCFFNPFLSPRLLDFWNLPFSSLAQPEVTVRPGTVVVPAKTAITLQCLPRSGRYPSARLTLATTDGERIASVFLRPDSSGGFAYRLDSVGNSFVYRFGFGGASPRTDTVTVVPPPRLYRVNVTVQPPAYTGRSTKVLPEGQGNFEAYAGSHARIAIESDHLSKAWLIRGSDSIALAINGQKAHTELQVTSPCTYTFVLQDTLGQRSDSLPRFQIGCIPDEPPSVQIVKPGVNKDLLPEQVETLTVEGIDDIGIRSMTLKWRRGGSRENGVGDRDLSVAAMPPVIRLSFIWRLTELSLYPGDTVYYWAEIVDTKPFGKPQRGVSDTFWFRIPTFQEIHEQLAQRQERAEKTIGAVCGRQSDIEEKLSSIVAAASGRKELTWEQKQILHDVKNELEAQADSLRKSLGDLKENIEKMKREGTAGEELSRKFDEVRKAVDELVKQYGDSLLFAAKDIDRPISLNEMRQAIEKVQEMLPKLNEQLDNVLKFLDLLKQDRRLAELAMRAERLSKEQSSLARDETGRQADLARQEELLDEIRKLSKDVSEEAKSDGSRMAELDSMPSRQRLDSMQKAMQSHLQQQEGLPRQETMHQMSGALLSLSEELMQMMNFNLAARLEKERDRLLSLSRDALALADWQEEIEREPDESRTTADLARAQQALKDALKKSRAVIDSLSMIPPREMLSLSRRFQDALAASEEVLGMLGMNDGGEAMAKSQTSLRSLANSALGALSQLDKGEQSGGGGGACMMPGLRKISGRQAAINSATADLLRSLLSGSQGSAQAMGDGNAQGMEEARRAAQKAQQAVADELKKLADNYGKEADEGLRGKVADLENEARRLAALLERPAADVTERQDRFLARMLETTLSMHREGEGKDEWKSRTAEQTFQEGNFVRKGDFFKDRDAFHRLRQKAFQGNFPEGYRQSLRVYFDALGEKYLK